MATLNDILMKEGVRDRVIDDGVVLIDQEVADKGGISGLAIKGGYAFVKAIKKGFVRDALDNLMDDFISRLDPFYQEHLKTHGSAAGFDASLIKDKSAVADGLLGVTDDRRNRSSNGGLRKAYDKLRPVAKANVEQAIPRLSKMVQKHLDREAK